MFIPTFTTNAMTSDFLLSISPVWVVMFLDSHHMVFTFLSWLDLLGVALAFQISILKICNLLPNYILTQGYRYHKLRKTFGKFFRSYMYSDLLSKFGEISFQEYVTERISHPVFYGDLIYKLRRVRCEANFVSSGYKIVKRLRRRKYDPFIIERTIGIVLRPSTAMYRSFLTHCTLTNKAVGTILRDLSEPPQRRQGPNPRPLWLLVGTLLALGPELASRRTEHSLLWWMSLYIFDILFLSPYIFV